MTGKSAKYQTWIVFIDLECFTAEEDTGRIATTAAVFVLRQWAYQIIVPRYVTGVIQTEFYPRQYEKGKVKHNLYKHCGQN